MSSKAAIVAMAFTSLMLAFQACGNFEATMHSSTAASSLGDRSDSGVVPMPFPRSNIPHEPITLPDQLQTGLRSELYPPDWKPGFQKTFQNQTARFQDYSYAGYLNSTVNLPRGDFWPVVDLTKAPYNADPTGQDDATAALQAALDDAVAKSGTILFLPEGTYLFDNKKLRWGASNVVLRGAGKDRTKLRFIYTQGEAWSHLWTVRSPDYATGPDKRFTKDAKVFDTSVEVGDATGLQPGDDIEIWMTLTREYAREHGMESRWSAFIGQDYARFQRTITKIEGQTVHLDVPIRYPVKTRDNARLKKVTGMLSNCGIENLSVGSAINYDAAWRAPAGLGMVIFKGVKDCWIRDVHSFAPNGANGYHIASKVFLLSSSKRVTIRDSSFRKVQNRGEGGNGYVLEMTRATDEILIENVEIHQARHAITLNSMNAGSGSVIRDTFTSGSWGWASKPSIGDSDRNAGGGYYTFNDIHKGIGVGLLIENSVIDDGWVTHNRGDMSENAGMTGTQNTFWNNKGKGIIESGQYQLGYIVGTAPGLTVTTTPDGQMFFEQSRRNQKFEGTMPYDYTEAIGREVAPRSLFYDQLRKRLGR